MTDNTDREAVERPCPNCGVTLNGHSGLRHLGTYVTHDRAYCLRYLQDQRDALLAAKEQAEANADMWHEESRLQYYRAEAAEAERDMWRANSHTWHEEARLQYHRAEKAEAEAAALRADHRRARDEVCELADYILNRDGMGLTEYEAKGLFADLQRLRLRMDKTLATLNQPKEGNSDDG